MKKVVILLAMVFVIGCDTTGCYDDETDWETDSEISSEMPSETPDLSEPGGPAGSRLIKEIPEVDSDDRMVGNDLERIVDPILNPSNELSTL